MSTKAPKIIAVVLAIMGLVYLGSLLNFKIDFTEEKRYTLSEASRNQLRAIDSEVFVKVYLSGSNLPGGFKRLEETVRQTLEDFRAEAGSKINYKFIDIYKDLKTDQERSDLMLQLSGLGIQPTNVYDNQNGQKTQSLVVPGAVLQQGDKTVGVLLLKGNKLAGANEALNQSCENVEYELASALRILNQKEKKKIGFFVKQSNIPAIKQVGLIELLKNEYDLFPVDLAASASLQGLDAIFVHKPTVAFTEADLFKIDQFIMSGGKALFFVDAVKIDTVSAEGNFASPINTGLEPLLYKYGLRINADLVKDYQLSAAIPLAVGNMGDKANIQLVPWPYFPLISNFGQHPMVRNLDAIYSQYISSIDTVQAPAINKTALLLSSAYTQTIHAPAAISYNMASQNFDPKKNSEGPKAFAYLLEGSFDSYFANKIVPDTTAMAFIEKAKPTQIVVCADADIAANDLDTKNRAPLPLGFDKFSSNTFANKDFIKNAVDYLMYPQGSIMSRNKAIVLRPLDKVEVAKNALFWQIFNLLLPLGLIAGIWATSYLLQRKKYL